MYAGQRGPENASRFDSLESEFGEQSNAQDFGIRFSGGIVLPVDSNGRTYLILHGESEVDIEHGLACVFGPDGRFGVTHADVSFSPLDPDGYDELAAVVDSAQT